jgi:2-dehydro-3-deoxy-D-arabinonate dehydratase
MQLCKVESVDGHVRIGVVEEDHVRFLDTEDAHQRPALSEILHAEHPAAVARELIEEQGHAWPIEELTVLPPLDRQEVWAAGVTYKRSEEARKSESQGAASFYDLVYKAPRPELFFKANPNRCVGHGGRVHIRADSKWSVPEPELALVLSPRLRLVGFTIGNDMSARDIEGENPLYLPQAKVYDGCCALGPAITLADAMPAPDKIRIHLNIERGGKTVFEGSTSAGQMSRSFADLIGWLGRACSFPHGVILLTGTGIVPPDDFSLRVDDVIHIDVSGIGRLSNAVACQSPRTN